MHMMGPWLFKLTHSSPPQPLSLSTQAVTTAAAAAVAAAADGTSGAAADVGRSTNS